jgi:hypothetical protein
LLTARAVVQVLTNATAAHPIFTRNFAADGSVRVYLVNAFNRPLWLQVEATAVLQPSRGVVRRAVMLKPWQVLYFDLPTASGGPALRQ